MVSRAKWTLALIVGTQLACLPASQRCVSGCAVAQSLDASGSTDAAPVDVDLDSGVSILDAQTPDSGSTALDVGTIDVGYGPSDSGVAVDAGQPAPIVPPPDASWIDAEAVDTASPDAAPSPGDASGEAFGDALFGDAASDASVLDVGAANAASDAGALDEVTDRYPPLLWFDADAPAQVLSNSEQVFGWMNLGTDQNHSLWQDVDTDKPIVISEAVGLRTGLQFTARSASTGQFLFVDMFDVIPNQRFSLFVVVRPTNPTIDATLVGFERAGYDQGMWLTSDRTSAGACVRWAILGSPSDELVSTDGISDGTPHVITVLESGSARTLRIDGAHQMTSNTYAGGVAYDVLTVGRRGAASPQEHFDGQMYEVLVFPRVLSASDVAAVEAHLLVKWALP